jgi:biopolymer transport protein ExbB
VWDIIIAAGWPIWPLIATSVFGVAIILERFWSLRESYVIPQNLMEDVKKLVGSGSIKRDAVEALRANSPLGEIMAVAIENQNSSLEIIKDSIEEAGSQVSYKLERYLGALSTISTVAPLLGLFGTIIGMVELFSSFTSSGHDVAVFRSGYFNSII